MIFNDGTVENAASALAQLIQTKLETVGYDKTLVYTITDDSNKEKGYYQVSDGDIKFDAYTDDTSYKKDNQVYVMIPQGDFSAKKIIIGRYVENEDKNKGVNYISPKDRFIPIYQNIIDVEENEKYQIIASEAESGRSYKIISKGDIAVTDLIDKNKSQNYIESDLTRFFLRVGLKSNLSIYNIISGDYGIGIIFVSTKNKVTALPEGFWDRDLNNILEDSEGYSFNRIELDSKDMIGNIYNYSGITYQSNIYDIASIGNIVGGIIYMYQDNNFKSQGLTSITNLQDRYGDQPDGIIELRHLNVGFGYGQEEFENDYNLLLTPDRTQDEFYKSGSSTDKNLNLRLIQKTDNSKYEYVGLGNKVEYFENSFEVEDNKAGLGWKAIEVNEGKVNFASKEPTKSFKALKTIVLNEQDVASNLVVESNILTYQNTDFSQNVSGIIALSCDEGTVFDFYGQDYRIDDSVQARTVKTIRATLPQAREFKKIEVVWTIPTGGTMLQHPLGNDLYKEYQPDNAVYNNFESIESFTITSTYETDSLTEVKLGFGIRDVYVPTYLNNKISCKIYYDNDYSYCDEGNILFAFGGYQTAGTDYKFGMFYQNPEVSCLYNYFTNGTPKMILQPHIINKDKTEEDLLLIAQTLQCKWKSQQQDDWSEVGQQSANKSYSSNSVKFSIVFEDNITKVVIVFNDEAQQDIISDILQCRINIGTANNPKYIEVESPIAIGYKAQEDTLIKRVSGVQAPAYINYDSFGAPLNNNNSIGLKLFMSEEKEDISTFNLKRNTEKQGNWVSVINSNLKYDQLGGEESKLSFVKNSNSPFACQGRIHKITLEGSAANLASLQKKSTQYLCHDYGINYWHKLLMIDCVEQTVKSDGQLKQTWWIYYIGRISGIVAGTQFGANTFKSYVDAGKVTLCSSQNADSVLGTVKSISEISDSSQNLPLMIVEYKDSSSSFSISKDQKILVNSYERIINTLDNECKSPIMEFAGEEYKYESELDWNFKVDDIDSEGYYTYLVEDENGNIVYTSNPHSQDTSLGKMLDQNGVDITNRSPEIYLISNKYSSFIQGENTLTLSNYEWDKIKCMEICSDLTPQIVLYLSDNSTKIVDVKLTEGSKEIKFNLDEAVEAIVKIPNRKYLYWTGSEGVISFSGVSWRIRVKSSKDNTLIDVNGSELNKTSLTGLPTIVTNEEFQYLQPYPIYCENNIIPYLEGYKIIENEEIVFWHQPIIITQDKYGYGVLNEWDGEKTNVGEGSIMSPCIGAGSKNSENQFSGVLMGKIKDTSDQINHGLYGFSDGAQAFGFKEDGTAFIGKSGAGRILFDGNNSTITSAQYQLNEGAWKLKEEQTNGMLLDLDDPKLHMVYNKKNVVDFSPKDNIMKLNSPEDGMSIDLINGSIKSDRFNLLSESGLANSVKRKLKLSTEENNGFFMGYDSDSSYIFDLPRVESGYNGVMSANSIKVGNLELKDSTLKYSGSTGFVGDFLSQNYMRYEANMITIKVSKGGKDEYYDIYLNTIVPLYDSTDKDKTWVRCTHFLDVRPNFDLGVNELSYFNNENLSTCSLVLTSEEGVVVNEKEVTKYKVELTSEIRDDDVCFKVLVDSTKENKQLNSLDTSQTINGGYQEDSKLYYPFPEGYSASIVSYNAAQRHLMTISNTNEIVLDVYQMKPDWIVTRNDRDPKNTNANKVLTQTISTIFGITEHNLEYSLGGDINSTEVFKVKINSTASEGVFGELFKRDKSISQGMWIDMAGNTYITDLYLRKFGVGSDKDFVGSKINDYIIDCLRGYLLSKCTEDSSRVYWTDSSWYVVGDKENITLEELISLAANASGARYN